MSKKIPAAVMDALDKTNMPYDIEQKGTKHVITIGGIYAGFVPVGGFSAGHAQANLISSIRRIWRQNPQLEKPQPSKETTPMTNPVTKTRDLSELPHLVKPEQLRLPDPTPTQKAGGYRPEADNIGEVIRLLRDIAAGHELIMGQNAAILDALGSSEPVEPREPREPRRVNSQELVMSILKAHMKPDAHYHVTELHRALNESVEPALVAPIKMAEVYRHTRMLWEAGKLRQVRRAVYEIIAQPGDEAEK